MKRLLVVTVLSAIVFAAHTHCVVSHAAEALRVHSDSQAPIDPLEESSCENESSCICKGATLAFVVPPPRDASGVWFRLCERQLIGDRDTMVVADQRLAWELAPRPPLPTAQGALACAQLGSFLI